MPAAEPRTRERILHFLKTKGPRTAAQVATRFKFTAVAARQHLSSLLEEGLVTSESERRPVGRPVQVWALTPKANRLFPDSHADLALGMIEAAKRAFGPTGIQKLLAERTAQLQRDYARELATALTLEARVRKLAELREREGYMAAAVRVSETEYLLVENHCPICAAANACTGICDGELELFQQVLGAEVKRTEHIVSGAARCVYEIKALPEVGSAASRA